MSYTSYNRRPTNTNMGYYPSEFYNEYSNYDTNNYNNGYSGDYDRGRYRGSQNLNYNNNNNNGYSTYDRDYYEDDHTRSYGPRRRNSYNTQNSYNNTQYYPNSPVTYSNVIPTSGQSRVNGGLYSTSRRKPVTVLGQGTARQAVPYLQGTSTTTSGFRARGERGEQIPVSNGLSYFEEGIPLSIWIRRLFGLGPRRSRGHIGQSVHVKRWDGWFSSGSRTARLNATVYTI